MKNLMLMLGYIANSEYIKEGLRPEKEYLNHLLEGKEYLSESYYENLKVNSQLLSNCNPIIILKS
jgi:hypothetical protein